MVRTVATSLLLILFAALSVAMFAYLIRSAARGTIRARGKRYVRSKQPLQFWTTLACGFICTGGVLIIIAWRALHWLSPTLLPALRTR